MLTLSEVFRSIQGESTWAGLPCVFVRLAGCNLHCNYCDTPYARGAGTPRTVEELAREVLAQKTPLAEITGGEPLLQPDAPKLADQLAAGGCTVLVETNGTRPLPTRRSFRAIVDWKTPGSGHPESFCRDNLSRLHQGDELKFVLCDRRDFDWARQRLPEIPAGLPVSFSPVTSSLPPVQLAEWILESGINVRLQLQLHTLLWPDTNRGV